MRKSSGVQWKGGFAKVGAVYYVRFYWDGIQKERSTGRQTLTEAKDWLRKELNRLEEEKEVGPVRTIPTFEDLVTKWEAAMKGSVGEKHLKTTKSFAKHHLVPAFNAYSLDDLDGGKVLTARAKYLENHAIPSANLWLRTLKLLLNFAITSRHIDRLPFSTKKVTAIKEDPRDRPVVPEEGDSLTKFLAHVKTKKPQVRVALIMALGLGMRESEILGMRWGWLDDQSAEKTYTSWVNKGKRKRVLPMSEYLLQELKTLPRTDDLIFPSELTEEYAPGLFRALPHRPKWLRKPLLAACKAASLGPMGMHRLRATFATWHIRKGVPLPDVQKLMGHQAITTTMIYNESAHAHLAKAQEGIGEILAQKGAGEGRMTPEKNVGGENEGKATGLHRKYTKKRLLMSRTT